MVNQNRQRIILHVGHGKTGTSYIQSALALSSEKLDATGIDYPEHRNFAQAIKGRITAGNLAGKEQWDQKILGVAHHSESNKTILFSSESLFNKILAQPERLAALAKIHSVRIILFIRNPLDHFRSSYGQSIKRSGYTGTVSEFISRYQTTHRALKLIETCKNLNIKICVRNYSNHFKDILSVFGKCISGDDFLVLEEPENKIVNRSLTVSELEIQKLFNKYIGAESSKFVSDVLANELPDLPPDVLPLTAEEISALINRIKEPAEALNRLIPSDERLIIPDPDLDHNEQDDIKLRSFRFSKDQLEVLVKSISRKILHG